MTKNREINSSIRKKSFTRLPPHKFELKNISTYTGFTNAKLMAAICYSLYGIARSNLHI